MWIRDIVGNRIIFMCSNCSYRTEYIAPFECPQCKGKNSEWQLSKDSKVPAKPISPRSGISVSGLARAVVKSASKPKPIKIDLDDDVPVSKPYIYLDDDKY